MLQADAVPPIVVYEHGDISMFEDLQSAERYLEATDVLANEYDIYDRFGRLLKASGSFVDTAMPGTHTIDDAESVVAFWTQELSCEGMSTGEPIPADYSGGGLQTHSDGRWQYNWATDHSWADSCRQLVIEFADGRFEMVTARFR